VICSHVSTSDARGQRVARRLWGSVALGTSQTSLRLAYAYSHRKSQLAIEYAYRVRQRSPDTWVFWVHASNSARLEAAFSDIAENVGLSSQPDAAVDALQLVRRWLCNKANGRWLMIVDNVDTDVVIEVQKEKEKVSLASLLPQTDHGAILITSRNADVARSLVGREKDIIAVGTMSDDEAIQLLGNNLGDKSMDGAIRLVNTLDCIPLAIV
jgi:NB-ARC domain